jgi:hypothetical protein
MNSLKNAPFAPHWITQLDANPLAKSIVQCFEPPGARIGTAVDSVEIGRYSLRIHFPALHRFAPVPLTGHSLAFRVLEVFNETELNFSIAFEAIDPGSGMYPHLAAIVEWKKNSNPLG